MGNSASARMWHDQLDCRPLAKFTVERRLPNRLITVLWTIAIRHRDSLRHTCSRPGVAMAYADELDLQDYVKALGRRATILRQWMSFFERYALLLTPVSCEGPLPVDFAAAEIIKAQQTLRTPRGPRL